MKDLNLWVLTPLSLCLLVCWVEQMMCSRMSHPWFAKRGFLPANAAALLLSNSRSTKRTDCHPEPACRKQAKRRISTAASCRHLQLTMQCRSFSPLRLKLYAFHLTRFLLSHCSTVRLSSYTLVPLHS